ncbi:hypothetical protein [Rubripirellula reticaptiva]|nr:hypothetical protein [Rubripirellula reticaptiva]
MPDSKEGFFWRVPARVKRIVIDANVQVRGGFRVLYREKANPLHIVGKDRKSSVIFGTDEDAWTDRNGVSENEKWKYSSVSVIEDAVVHVLNVTCLNPRGYIISGYANDAVIHVDSCSLLDTRDGNNNNSDGFAGAGGSSVTNSLISTADDGIKVYSDITIENTTIEHHRNGAPLQFGWGGKNETVSAQIKGLVIKGVDRENRYNMAPITWERGNDSVRNVSIDGLEVEIKGEVYNEEEMAWRPIGLFELKPSDCEFNLTAVNVKLNGLPMGLRKTKGTVDISEALK